MMDLKQERLKRLKMLIDQDWQPDIGGEFSEHDLRQLDYAKVLFAPDHSSLDLEPQVALQYVGPAPIYLLEEHRLVRPGELIGDWM